MCEYCNGLDNGDGLSEGVIDRKKVLEICGESIVLNLSLESYPRENGRRYTLVSCLEGDVNDIADYSLIQKDIKFCPFCGREFLK